MQGRKVKGGGGATKMQGRKVKWERGATKMQGRKVKFFYTVLSTEMDLWYCPASREMENISRGPYLLRFCHYPHRGVDTGQHGCKTTEYKSTDSPLPPLLDSIYRDQFSSGYFYCTVYNLRLRIFIVFGGFKILFRLYLLSPLPSKILKVLENLKKNGIKMILNR